MFSDFFTSISELATYHIFSRNLMLDLVVRLALCPFYSHFNVSSVVQPAEEGKVAALVWNGNLSSMLLPECNL